LLRPSELPASFSISSDFDISFATRDSPCFATVCSLHTWRQCTELLRAEFKFSRDAAVSDQGGLVPVSGLSRASRSAGVAPAIYPPGNG
jgi:hypothetical protein